MHDTSYLTPEQIDIFFDGNTKPTRKTTRKERRAKKKAANNVKPAIPYIMKTIKPLTMTQSNIMNCYNETDQNMFLHGFAGTGKSFLSIHLLMKTLLSSEIYKKLVIIRSTVPSRDQGFLPGTAEEKAKVYEIPYQGIFADLFGRDSAYDHFKRSRKVEFESTSYLRGTTFNDCLVFVDEVQNMTRQEMFTVLTRIGENCRVIISGDFHQTDLKFDREKQGMFEAMKILKMVPMIDFFEFKKEDIVRSEFVKQLLIAESKYKERNY